jgi:hypothetical protein
VAWIGEESPSCSFFSRSLAWSFFFCSFFSFPFGGGKSGTRRAGPLFFLLPAESA